jgi:hypothetical protein
MNSEVSFQQVEAFLDHLSYLVADSLLSDMARNSKRLSGVNTITICKFMFTFTKTFFFDNPFLREQFCYRLFTKNCDNIFILQ